MGLGGIIKGAVTGGATGLMTGGPVGAVVGAGAGGVVGGLASDEQNGGGAGSAFMDPGSPDTYYVPGLPNLAQQYGNRQTPFVTEEFGAPVLMNANSGIPYNAAYMPAAPSQAYLDNRNLVRQAANRLPPPGPSPTNPGGYQVGGLSRFRSTTPVTAQNYQQYERQTSTMPTARSGMTYGSASSVPGATNQVVAGAYPNQMTAAPQQQQQTNFSSAAGPGFRTYQEQLSSDLLAQARGQAPSLAEQMYHNAMDTNARQQLSLAAGARGNRMLALRNAQINASQFGAETAGQLAAARLAERQQAQGLLGQVSGQGRGMDINVAQGNQGAALQQQQLNQQGQLDALRLQQQGLQAYQNARTTRATEVAPGTSLSDQLVGGGANLADIYLKTRQNNVPSAGQSGSGLSTTDYNNLYNPNAFKL